MNLQNSASTLPRWSLFLASAFLITTLSIDGFAASHGSKGKHDGRGSHEECSEHKSHKDKSMRKGHHKMMQKHIMSLEGLSAAQKTSLKDVFSTNKPDGERMGKREQMHALFSAAKLDLKAITSFQKEQEQMAVEKVQHRFDMMRKIAAILTAEQRQELAEKHKGYKEKD